MACNTGCVDGESLSEFLSGDLSCVCVVIFFLSIIYICVFLCDLCWQVAIVLKTDSINKLCEVHVIHRRTHGLQTFCTETVVDYVY